MSAISKGAERLKNPPPLLFKKFLQSHNLYEFSGEAEPHS